MQHVARNVRFTLPASGPPGADRAPLSLDRRYRNKKMIGAPLPVPSASSSRWAVFWPSCSLFRYKLPVHRLGLAYGRLRVGFCPARLVGHPEIAHRRIFLPFPFLPSVRCPPLVPARRLTQLAPIGTAQLIFRALHTPRIRQPCGPPPPRQNPPPTLTRVSPFNLCPLRSKACMTCAGPASLCVNSMPSRRITCIFYLRGSPLCSCTSTTNLDS